MALAAGTLGHQPLKLARSTSPSLPKYKGIHVKGPQQERLPIKALPLTNNRTAACWFLLSRFHISVHWRGTKPGS